MYKLRCNACRQTFNASDRNAPCTKCRADRDYGSTLVEDVLETAVDVATAYFMVDVAADVIGGVGSMIGSIFD